MAFTLKIYHIVQHNCRSLVLFACQITQGVRHKINLVYLLQASKHVPHNPLGEIRPVIEYQWCTLVA